MPKDSVIAGDGLPARRSGAWAREKLSFIDDFVPPGLQATRAKRDRWYVDLFAGPGKNVDDAGKEFDGAALRALRASATTDERVAFTRAVLVNLDPQDHASLTARVDTLAERGELRPLRRNVELLNADANGVVHRIMRDIHDRAYAFVMADIEAPRQLAWSTVAALKSHGHRSVDLFVLFPLDMGLNRMLSYRTETVEESADTLTRFFGCEDWRPLVEQRVTDAQSPAFRRSLLELYIHRLQGLGWKYVTVVRDVKRVGDSGLYKMIYASNHPAGRNLGEWSADRRRQQDQTELF